MRRAVRAVTCRPALAPARWWCRTVPTGWASAARAWSSLPASEQRGCRRRVAPSPRGGLSPTARRWAPPPFGVQLYELKLDDLDRAARLGIYLPPPNRLRSCRSIAAVAFSTRSQPRDYYEVLGSRREVLVARSLPNKSSAPTLSVPRKCHPDLNPGDSNATYKFQELSHAYSVLKDPASRAQYDSTGTDPGQEHGGFGDWEREWQQVWEEFGFEHYLKEVRDEGRDAVSAIREHNDWLLAGQFVGKHRVLVLGVLLPLAVSLRFPALIWGGLRVASFIAMSIFGALPNPSSVASSGTFGA